MNDHPFASKVVSADEAVAYVKSGMRVFVHAPYLVNLGSPTPATYEKSVHTVAHNLKRAAEIGAEGVVVHTGSPSTAAPATNLKVLESVLNGISAL